MARRWENIEKLYVKRQAAPHCGINEIKHNERRKREYYDEQNDI